MSLYLPYNSPVRKIGIYCRSGKQNRTNYSRTVIAVLQDTGVFSYYLVISQMFFSDALIGWKLFAKGRKGAYGKK